MGYVLGQGHTGLGHQDPPLEVLVLNLAPKLWQELSLDLDRVRLDLSPVGLSNLHEAGHNDRPCFLVGPLGQVKKHVEKFVPFLWCLVMLDSGEDEGQDG